MDRIKEKLENILKTISLTSSKKDYLKVLEQIEDVLKDIENNGFMTPELIDKYNRILKKIIDIFHGEIEDLKFYNGSFEDTHDNIEYYIFELLIYMDNIHDIFIDKIKKCIDKLESKLEELDNTLENMDNEIVYFRGNLEAKIEEANYNGIRPINDVDVIRITNDLNNSMRINTSGLMLGLSIQTHIGRYSNIDRNSTIRTLIEFNLDCEDLFSRIDDFYQRYHTHRKAYDYMFGEG